MESLNSERTSLAERLLLKFCRPAHPESPPYNEQTPVEEEMRALHSGLPELKSIVQGMKVLDFGCGTGSHAIGLATLGAKSVVGLDINERFLEIARTTATKHGVNGKVEFKSALSLAELGSFDVVLSYNSMEHFTDPLGMIALMKAAVSTNGRIVIAFSPPWYSAYGAHFSYITPIPWVHLIFSERLLMKVRTRYKNDGALRFEDIEGGLNKMTVSKFLKILRSQELSPEWIRLTATKRLPLVTKIPVLREFATVRVACSVVAR
jgi:SAM-dependent methyltransferase